MKLKNIFFIVVIIVLVFTACNESSKKEVQKPQSIEVSEGAAKTLALNISGMTCEIGCAKVIESKLSKRDGVIDAKVVFNDSIATIKYDPTKTNKASLISFVGGIADNMYTASEIDCKKSCDKDKKACSEDKKACKGKDKSCDKTNKACATACCEGEKVGETCEKKCATTCEKKCCA